MPFRRVGVCAPLRPIAVVGYGLADMLTDRRISLGGTAIAAIGLALLADAQEWVRNDNVVWDTLLVFIGLAVPVRPREDARRLRWGSTRVLGPGGGIDRDDGPSEQPLREGVCGRGSRLRGRGDPGMVGMSASGTR